MSCHLTFCNLRFFVRVLPQSCCFSAYKPLQGCICHTLLRWVLLLPTPLPKAEISMLLSHSLSVPHQSIICHQSYGFSLIFLCILYIHPVFIQCIRLGLLLMLPRLLHWPPNAFMLCLLPFYWSVLHPTNRFIFLKCSYNHVTLLHVTFQCVSISWWEATQKLFIAHLVL